MYFEQLNNVSKASVFRATIPPGTSGYLDAELKAHGFIKNVKIRFAAGENGTLHVRPTIVLPGEIPVDLLSYADGGDKYVSGDDETFSSDLKFEIENYTKVRVWYENTGVGNSILNVDVITEYYSISEPENVIGPRKGV